MKLQNLDFQRFRSSKHIIYQALAICVVFNSDQNVQVDGAPWPPPTHTSVQHQCYQMFCTWPGWPAAASWSGRVSGECLCYNCSYTFLDNYKPHTHWDYKDFKFWPGLLLIFMDLLTWWVKNRDNTGKLKTFYFSGVNSELSYFPATVWIRKMNGDETQSN